jgi:hypothetical protein
MRNSFKIFHGSVIAVTTNYAEISGRVCHSWFVADLAILNRLLLVHTDCTHEPAIFECDRFGTFG